MSAPTTVRHSVTRLITGIRLVTGLAGALLAFAPHDRDVTQKISGRHLILVGK